MYIGHLDQEMNLSTFIIWFSISHFLYFTIVTWWASYRQMCIIMINASYNVQQTFPQKFNLFKILLSVVQFKQN